MDPKATEHETTVFLLRLLLLLAAAAVDDDENDVAVIVVVGIIVEQRHLSLGFGEIKTLNLNLNLQVSVAGNAEQTAMVAVDDIARLVVIAISLFIFCSKRLI